MLGLVSKVALLRGLLFLFTEYTLYVLGVVEIIVPVLFAEARLRQCLSASSAAYILTPFADILLFPEA